MGYCKQCHADILDKTDICPLCRSVLEQTEERKNMYPDIQIRERKIKLAIRIYVVAALVLELILIYINYRTFNGTWWCVITGGGLIMGWLTMKLLAEKEYRYGIKTFAMVFLSLLYIILIDYILGFERWSLNIVFPGAIFAINALVVILMIINFRNWQSYISWQIFTILLSILAVVLLLLKIITWPYMAEVALFVSVLFFVGTLIIGGRRATTELKRRFHFR